MVLLSNLKIADEQSKEIIFTDSSFNLAFIQVKKRYLCEKALKSTAYIVLDIASQKAQQHEEFACSCVV